MVFHAYIDRGPFLSTTDGDESYDYNGCEVSVNEVWGKGAARNNKRRQARRGPWRVFNYMGDRKQKCIKSRDHGIGPDGSRGGAGRETTQ